MSTPARLGKIEQNHKNLILTNPVFVKFCLILSIIVLMILCIALTYAVFGTSVESGNYYNHIKDVI